MRIKEIDLLRGVGILAVVMVHIAQHAIFYSYGNPITNIILDALSRFCVPFFVFVSGVSFAYNYHNREGYYRNFLLKRLKYIGIPYLIWSAVGFARYGTYDPIKIIIGLITGNAMIHLYFVILIFQFYLLSPILLRLIKKNWLWTTIISFIINILLLAIHSYTPMFVDINTGKYLQPYINLFIWLSYFMTGMSIGIKIDEFNKLMKRTKISILAIIWLIVTIISVYEEYIIYANMGYVIHFFRPTNMLYSFMSILLFWKLYEKLSNLPKRVLVSLGKYSFGIYLVHIPILFTIHKFTQPYWGNPLELIFSFLSCAFASYIFTFLVSKIKIGTLIIGKTG